MRPHLLPLALCLLCLATPASATPLEGAWGLGVRLFTYGGGEVSLLHGVSDRTAWLFDVSASQTEELQKEVYAPDGGPNDAHLYSSLVASAGPRLRRFTRPDADFSPYWDVFAHGTYGHSRSRYSSLQSLTSDRWGAEGGLDFGLEYFTRWHCSLAAHTSLLTVSWEHLTEKASGSTYATETRGHHQTASLGLDPSLILRVYF